MDQLKIHFIRDFLAAQAQGTVNRGPGMQSGSRAGKMLSASAGIQNAQSQDLGHAWSLCGSLRDPHLYVQLLGTAA